MAYEKNTWAKGDTITAAKLNNLEGGVDQVSTVVDSAVAVGGIAYVAPDQLITHIAAEGTTVSPAIIELEESDEYTFKFVDEINPEGIVLTSDGEFDSDTTVAWRYVSKYSDGDVGYEIIYNTETNTNTFNAYLIDEKAIVGSINSDIYTPGSLHKISSEFIPIHIVSITASGGTYTCSETASQIRSALEAGDPVIAQLHNPSSGQDYSTYVWTSDEVAASFNRDGVFEGIIIKFCAATVVVNTGKVVLNIRKVTIPPIGTITVTFDSKTITPD